MKFTGIVRRIDDLGRIVIPKDIRKQLKIKEGDAFKLFIDNEGHIIWEKYNYYKNYEIGKKLLEKIVKAQHIEHYEIVEDSYEYEYGLMLIVYNDEKHEEEVYHICIDLEELEKEE